MEEKTHHLGWKVHQNSTSNWGDWTIHQCLKSSFSFFRCQSPSKKSLRWAPFMKQNFIFGLVWPPGEQFKNHYFIVIFRTDIIYSFVQNLAWINTTGENYFCFINFKFLKWQLCIGSNLTTIPVVVGVWSKFSLLYFKTCWL